MFDRQLFKQYEEDFSIEREESFVLIKGSGAVMISAPHSVAQTRNGNRKRPEEQTGPLAKMLHNELNCPVIYKTKNCGDDANYDLQSGYKDAIVEYISTNNVDFLLDLHLLSAKRDIVIDIGTGMYNNVLDNRCVDIAVDAFVTRGFCPVEIDKPFAAKSPRTISAYVANKCKISCLQIEINSKVVYDAFDTERIEDVYAALKEIVENLQNNCKKDKN